ncbi:MAG: hypothetical protein U0350_29815 [Caldilineaceae bacterium]
MKTTIEIPNELFRQAKAKAALAGIPLKDLVVYGLQLALEKPIGPIQCQRTTFPLIKAKDKSRLLTDEDVAAAQAALDDTEAAHYASFVRR